ncbi:MAG: DUF86 domain-containing protein [Pseudomonadota bacterium]
MMDISLINRKIALLVQAKKELEGYGVKSLTAFERDRRDQKAVQKILQEMVEICMDMGKHIIADEGFRFPEDSRDIFTVLGENAVISEKTMMMMHKMVGFRNILVHLYEKIDLEIVYGIYKKRLDDFDSFVSEVNSFMNKRAKS